MRLSRAASAVALFSAAVHGILIANQTDAYLLIANDRLTASVAKSRGIITFLTLDGQNLLGNEATTAVTPGGSTGNGTTGIGPYLDCYCTPAGAYTPGASNATFQLYQGTDSQNVSYGGMSMHQVYKPTGIVLEQYWFLRDGETGLHVFSRLYYHNETTYSAGKFQEFRTLFRPDLPTSIWTHLITDETVYAALPVPNPASGSSANSTTVQDATWYLGNRTNDAYVEDFADYFTKYTFANVYGDHTVHGLYGDGSLNNDSSVWGAWLVMNTKDTYFGGPTWSDLTVDGILYNYIVSNHHGNQAPNITSGMDRTFGPFFYHYNHAQAGTSWQELRDEAVEFANPQWNAAFYDSIADLVPKYVPTSGRGSWKATVNIPEGGTNPRAVLTANGYDFQDNSNNLTAYQYWADIDHATGEVSIDRIKAGTYRLTVYADHIFGDYIQDGVVVEAGETTDGGCVTWIAESAGTELWRLGTP